MFLSALQQPDFRTINRFRKDHLPVVKELFNQIVRLCIEMGMVNLGSLALDGTKLKANASDRKTLRARDLDKELLRIDKEIEEILRESEEIDAEEDGLLGEDQGLYEIPPELRDKKIREEKLQRAKEKLQEQQLKESNLTDNDCTTMLHGPQGFKPSYNGQIAVEEGRGIIIAANLSTNPADNLALKELIEQVEANTGEKPEAVLADSGFSSYANLQYLNDREITGFIPDQGTESIRKGNCKNPAYHKSQFTYNVDNDTYTCPEGKLLKYYKTSKRPYPRPPFRIYRAKDCTACPVKLNCARSQYRYLRQDPREPLMLKMRELLDTPEGRVKSAR
ncbi:transposase, partial [Candidatus Hakubella thermalkaliphila]